MINPEKKPQFRNYPLSKQQIVNLHDQKASVEKQIRDNNAELRLLHSKIAKDDYDHKNLDRLHERDRILMNKRRELQEILQMQKFLQNQNAISKQNENRLKHNLATQYKNVMEEKKIRASQQRRMRIEEEKRQIQFNQAAFQQEMMRKKQQSLAMKRNQMEQLKKRDDDRRRERESQMRQKQEFSKRAKLMNSLQTQKQAIYKQYYSQFLNEQNKLQGMYENQVAPINQQRDYAMQQFLRKQEQQYAEKVNRQQQQRYNRAIQQRDALRSYLQQQMEQKNRKKQQQKQQQRYYGQMMNKYQNAQKQIDYMERQRKLEQQRRYDEDLSHQLRTRDRRGMSSDKNYMTKHNPITNPIDFKIGITNPYVIKQYQQTKQRYMGDHNLKLKNLAMVGNSSLSKQ